MIVAATRELETSLLATHACVGGMDEVGRGAIAGPVVVGLALVDANCGEAPAGLADSKLLTPIGRSRLVEPCRAWTISLTLGQASPAEIDRWGIIAALRLAGRRALEHARKAGHVPDIIILDGSHDWLTVPPPDLLCPPDHPDLDSTLPGVPRTMTQVKADRHVAVCAAASVVAKVERDALMADLDDPGYGWASNKGYLSSAHRAGLEALGPSPWHRHSWKIPGKRMKTHG